MSKFVVTTCFGNVTEFYAQDMSSAWDMVLTIASEQGIPSECIDIAVAR